MTTETLSAIAKAILLPPNSLFILMMLGALVALRFTVLGRTMVIVGVALLVILSTPIAGSLLIRGLTETEPVSLEDPPRTSSAIVILGAESTSALELGGETVGQGTLERLRYGARLHRELGLPVLVTGGGTDPDRQPVGDLMAETLETDFGVPVRWKETQSRNTFENAAFSHRILEEGKIETIYLVTHALHMKRARDSFAAAGLEVLTAPVGVYDPKTHRRFLDYVPSAHGLAGSTAAVYELLGRMWYRFHYLS